MTAGLQIAVVGAGKADPKTESLARDVGRAIASAGATLLTGGGGGVMQAAFEGARDAGGHTVAIRPEPADPAPPNAPAPYDVRIWTGLGQARNVVLVLSADAVIAIGGEWGTLSEIGLAAKHGKPTVLLDSWNLRRPDGAELDELIKAKDPQTAVRLALERARGSS